MIILEAVEVMLNHGLENKKTRVSVLYEWIEEKTYKSQAQNKKVAETN